jgi:hypothetical protein
MAGLGAPSGEAGAWSSLRLAIRVSRAPSSAGPHRERPSAAAAYPSARACRRFPIKARNFTKREICRLFRK